MQTAIGNTITSRESETFVKWVYNYTNKEKLLPKILSNLDSLKHLTPFWDT